MLKRIAYKIKRLVHFIKTGILEGVPAQIITGFPQRKLQIIMVTGTDGKTTTSTLLYEILKQAEVKVGLITTVAAYIGDEQLDTGFHVTAPSPKFLYKVLKKMVDAGCTHVVLEMTSHGAYQFRNWGIRPVIAGLTNISREHLDYHLNYHEYVKAKLLILDSAQTAILNADDYSFEYIEECDRITPRMETYSATDALPQTIATAITKRFPEPYNQMNARLATAIATRLGIEQAPIAEAISGFSGVPGRMQVVAEKPVRIIVDFAHTPNSVALATQSLKKQYPKGRLIVVHGSAGLRDAQKRPAMGRASTDHADLVVFTAEDPRTENVWSIIRQMKEGLTNNHAKVVSIADRKEAITAAITEYAKPGDTVAILGKGHETSMCYGTTETPWSDVGAVEEILSKTKKHSKK